MMYYLLISGIILWGIFVLNVILYIFAPVKIGVSFEKIHLWQNSDFWLYRQWRTGNR